MTCQPLLPTRELKPCPTRVCSLVTLPSPCRSPPLRHSHRSGPLPCPKAFFGSPLPLGELPLSLTARRPVVSWPSWLLHLTSCPSPSPRPSQSNPSLCSSQPLCLVLHSSLPHSLTHTHSSLNPGCLGLSSGFPQPLHFPGHCTVTGMSLSVSTLSPLRAGSISYLSLFTALPRVQEAQGMARQGNCYCCHHLKMVGIWRTLEEGPLISLGEGDR